MGYYSRYGGYVNKDKINSSPGVYTDPKFVDSSTAELYNLFVSSTPAGLTTVAMTTPSWAWSSTYGFMTGGDAGTSTSYPLRTINGYTGYVLAQSSVLFENSCSDPSLCVFQSGTSPLWAWAVHSSRIALSNNCQGPNLYGKSLSSVANGSVAFGPGVYVTHHLAHDPDNNQTRAWVTQGLNDWTSTGTMVGSVMSIAESFTGTSVQFGLSSDYDGVSPSATSTNFSALRISTDVIN